MQCLNTQFTQTFLQSILSSIDSKDPVAATAWLETLRDVVDLLPVEVLQAEVIDIVRSKSQPSQPVFCRISTCQLIGKLAKRLIVPIVQAELLPMAESLSQDEDPAVRAAICNQLIYLMKGLLVMPSSACNNVLIQMLVDATSDTALEVKLAALDCLSSVSGILDKGTCTSVIIPLVRTLCKKSLEEQDWTLPVIATHLGNLCKNLQVYLSEDDKDWLLEFYAMLSELGVGKQADTNVTKPDLVQFESAVPPISTAEMFFECRIACAVNLPHMAHFVTWNTQGPPLNRRSDILLKALGSLSADPYPQVRRHVATALLKVSKYLGSLSRPLHSAWICLLKDSNYEVVCALVSDIGPTLDHFSRLAPASESNTLSLTCGSLLLCEQQLASTRNWRSQAEFWAHVALLPLYHTCPSVHDTFVPVIFDRIHNSRPLPVRLSATHTLVWFLRTEVRESHRKMYCQKIVSELAKGKNYHSRMLFLKMCDMLLDVVSRAFFKQYFWEALLALSGDKVPNVRLRFCSLLPAIKKVACDDSTSNELDAIIKNLLSSEQDRDVKFQLQKSLQLTSVEIPATQIKEESEEDKRREMEENAVTKSGTPTVATDALQPLLLPRNDSAMTQITSENLPLSHPGPAKDEFLVDAGVPLSSTSISQGSVHTPNSRIPTPFASKLAKPPKSQMCLRPPRVQKPTLASEPKDEPPPVDLPSPKSIRSRISTGGVRDSTVKRSLVASASKSKSQENLDAPLRAKINAHVAPRPVSISLASPVSSRSSSPVRELKRPTKFSTETLRCNSRLEKAGEVPPPKNSSPAPAFVRNQFRASTGSRPQQLSVQNKAATPIPTRKNGISPPQQVLASNGSKSQTLGKTETVNASHIPANSANGENGPFVRQTAWRKSVGSGGNFQLVQPKAMAPPKMHTKLFPEVPSTTNNNVCKIPLPCTKNLIKF